MAALPSADAPHVVVLDGSPVLTAAYANFFAGFDRLLNRRRNYTVHYRYDGN